MRTYILFLFLLVSQSVIGQVTLDNTILPEIGDAIEYQNFVLTSDTMVYKQTGEDMLWEFEGLEEAGLSTDAYRDITGTELADSFPDANVLFDFDFFESAGLRTENTLELVGVRTENFDFFGIGGIILLEDNFVLEKFPLDYGDSYDDDFALDFTLSAEILPFLDSLESPIPGATIDSIRLTIATEKEVEVSGWGTVRLNDKDYEALQLKQTDITETIIEIGIGIAGTVLWFNVTDLLGDIGGGGDDFGDFGSGESVTYRYLSPDVKGTLIEFNEQSFADTLGNEIIEVTGRYYSDLLSNTENIVSEPSSFQIYPNPSLGVINLKADMNRADVILRDINGKVVISQRDFDLSQAMNLSLLPAGYYVIEISEEEQNPVRQKFLKK